MFGNPQRYKASLQRFENRHATAGCLLAVLFLVPFLARNYNILMISTAVLLYVTLVVPLAVGYITTGDLFSLAKRFVVGVLAIFGEGGWLRIRVWRFWLLIQWFHHVYLHLENIHTTTNQVFFNLIVEKVLCPDQRFACLYVLLFYTVLAYLQQSLQKRQWSQVLNETSTADFIRLTTAFVVARMGKAVVMGLVLLTFSLQFNDLEPTISYVIITAIYFMLSQYPGIPGEETYAVNTVRQLDIPELEGLEEWWLPLFTRITTIIFSLIFILIAAVQRGHWFFAILISYVNVAVPFMKLVEDCWKPLKTHRLETSVYPIVTSAQLQKRGDQCCPICLDNMRPLSARITPCSHIFHAHCLRKCIKQFKQCPLCKHNLL
ncbi:uncharacterized protein LOC142330193 isoform X2 [Lycorma delicatula]